MLFQGRFLTKYFKGDIKEHIVTCTCIYFLVIFSPRVSGLIQLRNELAHHLHSSSVRGTDGKFGALPAPINSARSCAQCAHLISCTAYQR